MNNWRLPKIEELLSLVDYGRHNPALPDGHLFIDHKLSNSYWSSTPYANNPGFAWSVYFYDSYDYCSSKYSNYYVRCVRGEQRLLEYSGSRFELASEKEVIDKKTGLIWQRESVGPIQWEEALEFAERLNAENKMKIGGMMNKDELREKISKKIFIEVFQKYNLKPMCHVKDEHGGMQSIPLDRGISEDVADSIMSLIEQDKAEKIGGGMNENNSFWFARD